MNSADAITGGVWSVEARFGENPEIPITGGVSRLQHTLSFYGFPKGGIPNCSVTLASTIAATPKAPRGGAYVDLAIKEHR